MSAFDFPAWATNAPALKPPDAKDAAEAELIAANRKAFAEAQEKAAQLFSQAPTEVNLGPNVTIAYPTETKRKGWPKGKPRGPRAQK
jgi:hypothetical protein